MIHSFLYRETFDKLSITTLYIRTQCNFIRDKKMMQRRKTIINVHMKLQYMLHIFSLARNSYQASQIKAYNNGEKRVIEEDEDQRQRENERE